MLFPAITVAVAAVMAFALFACGEQGAASPTSAISRTEPDSPGQQSPSPEAAPSSSAVQDPGSQANSRTKDASTDPATPFARFETAFDVSATVDVTCLRPGDRQTITITTLPETTVAYHAEYSDGKDAFDPGYYGGNNGGVTGEEGRWTDSWVVAPAAPPGRVRVDVVAQGSESRGYAQLFFDIADASGECEP